jgi:hypothetical protein
MNYSENVVVEDCEGIEKGGNEENAMENHGRRRW